MPSFSDAQKAAIRQYMGFSELFHDIDPRLEGQMTDLGARAPDAVNRIIANLNLLADIDARLLNTQNLDALIANRVEDVYLNGSVQMDTLRDQGRMLINQIAITFELEPKRDYYSIGHEMGGMFELG